jgi:rhamnulokinase
VAGIPSSGDDWAFISSGTWSLLGTVIPTPCITKEGLAANFTNEGGAGGGIRYLKNVIGLWLLQECRRHWESKGRKFTYGELTAKAEKAGSPKALLDVNEEALLRPGDMPGRINAQLRRRGKPTVSDPGMMTRLILESLAAEYGVRIADVRRITGKRLNRLHIVGGGSQNQLLNRLTAQRTGLRVLAGPTESTSLGNFAVQLAALEGAPAPSAIASFARRFGEARELDSRQIARSRRSRRS